jgi:hypothetical protein
VRLDGAFKGGLYEIVARTNKRSAAIMVVCSDDESANLLQTKERRTQADGNSPMSVAGNVRIGSGRNRLEMPSITAVVRSARVLLGAERIPSEPPARCAPAVGVPRCQAGAASALQAPLSIPHLIAATAGWASL